MTWKKGLIVAALIIIAINMLVVTALPDEFLWLNVIFLAGIFAIFAYVRWYRKSN